MMASKQIPNQTTERTTDSLILANDTVLALWRFLVLVRSCAALLQSNLGEIQTVGSDAEAEAKNERYNGLRLETCSTLIEASKLFDARFYNQVNEDVSAAGGNALYHFITYGGEEGRWPSPFFDTGSYLKANPDVKDSAINPLLHYILYGCAESRAPVPNYDFETELKELQHSLIKGTLDKFFKQEFIDPDLRRIFDLVVESMAGIISLSTEMDLTLRELAPKALKVNILEDEISHYKLLNEELTSKLYASNSLTGKMQLLLEEQKLSINSQAGIISSLEQAIEGHREEYRRLEIEQDSYRLLSHNVDAISSIAKDDTFRAFRSGSTEFISSEQFLSGFEFELLRKSLHIEENNVDPIYAPLSATLGRTEFFQLQIDFMAFVKSNAERLCRALNALNDNYSRNLYIDLLLYRSLGHRNVKLATNTARFWSGRSESANMMCSPSRFSSLPGGENIFNFNLEHEGHELSLDCMRANLFFTFHVKQYYFERDGQKISPLPGDHVVDAGGCFGDTAVCFAKSVGDEGKIYTFDPLPLHREIIAHNIAQNALKNITIFPSGLSDQTVENDIQDFSINPGFSIDQLSHNTVTLDSLVAKGSIERVDFIKMDIEGYELSALKGSLETLRKYKPRMAISIYHRWSDYFEIFELIDNLDLGYKFYLDNYTISDGETVLYCVT